MHKGSKDTYDYIANWYDCPIPFSRSDGWGRYGILGVIGDLILYGVKGSIAEIGVGESSIYLTQLARKHNRKIYYCDVAAGKITNPLTIPGYLSEECVITKDGVINKDCKAVGFIGTSDKFFTAINFPPIALAYIDGDHSYEQVKKDFWNMDKIMADDGVIFIHDTYPPNESFIDENRCGTVYKLRQDIEALKQFDIFTFTKIAGVGVGVSMVRRRKEGLPWFQM